jgi:ubiquinone/menaquinone biosynthesis C-methylase UbiE
MRTQELGLILGHQLLGLDDLHFGIWDDDLQPGYAELARAQQRYSEQLLNELPGPGGRVLDVGCGTGKLMWQLWQRGYPVDGVAPVGELATLARRRIRDERMHDVHLYECPFEKLPLEELAGRYDILLFSESFQYIKMPAVLAGARRLLKPGGRLVICDMFRGEHDGDGAAGDGVIKGGHSLAKFYRLLDESPFRLEQDTDITRQVSPTIDVVCDFLMRRLKPAGDSVHAYLEQRFPVTSWWLKKLLRRRLERFQHRYLSGLYNAKTFERYKSYRRISCLYEGS